MSRADEVLAAVAQWPGLTDKQLSQRTGIMPVPYVNAICRRLAAQRRISRVRGGEGKLINVPADAAQTSSVVDRSTTRSIPVAIPQPEGGRSAMSEDEKLHRIAQLPLARTLLVIPCSKRKEHDGPPVSVGPHLSDELPHELSDRLTQAQRATAPKARIATTTSLPAWRRYRGTFYVAADEALAAAVQRGTHVLILSGGYGVVLAAQPVGDYDAILHPGWWPQRILQDCLVAYAKRHHLTAVVGFAGGSTAYAKVIRAARWRDADAQSFLLSPELKGQGGAQKTVPQSAFR